MDRSKWEMCLCTLLLSTFTTKCGCGHTGIEGDTEVERSVAFDQYIENLGDTGWRDSTEPLCTDTVTSIVAYDVWSNIGGVYVLVADYVDMGDRYEEVNHIYYNDGGGWELAYDRPSSEDLGTFVTCFHRIMGSHDDSIYLWSGLLMECKLYLLNSGSIIVEEIEARQLFVVNSDLIYSCTEEGIFEFNGDTWNRISTQDATSATDMWASEGVVYFSSGSGMVGKLIDGVWEGMDTGTTSDLFTGGFPRWTSTI